MWLKCFCDVNGMFGLCFLRDDWDSHQEQHSSQSSGEAEDESYSRQPEPLPSRKTNGRFSSAESQVVARHWLIERCCILK